MRPPGIRLVATDLDGTLLDSDSEVSPRTRAALDACWTAGIPVVGHLGYTPQSENLLGGPRVQGRGDLAAELLCEDAVAVQEAGLDELQAIEEEFAGE